MRVQNLPDFNPTDGNACTTIEELHRLLKGSDIPGSSVIVTVRKQTTVTCVQAAARSNMLCCTSGKSMLTMCAMSPQGETIDVELVRMQSEVIADKRRLFELFATLKDRAVGKHLCFGSSLF